MMIFVAEEPSLVAGGPAMKLLAAVVGLAVVVSTAQAETVTSRFFMCRNVETVNRLSAMAGDQHWKVFLKQQLASGECTFTPDAGSPVRVEQRQSDRVCIAAFGSLEPCQWTYSNMVQSVALMAMPPRRPITMPDLPKYR
jgi:hypothetical protein